jgi:riboflavin kinase/FMN adenylyltransferase
MEIIRNLSEYNFSFNTVVTIGNFDGIHLGHQKIINTVKDISVETHYKSIVVTFNPHPLKYFKSDIKLINTERKKIELISKNNIDYMIILEFNDSMASMPAEIFVKEILLKKLKAKYIILGYNCRFGKKRLGNYELLSLLSKNYGFQCIKIDRVVIDNLTASSTNIRKLLQEGQIQVVNTLLGRFYELEGIVSKGNNLGKLIGFPTANIDTHNEMLPKLGVYTSLIKIGDNKQYPSVTCIGTRPTISTSNRVTVETHIMNFDEDIYDTFVELALISYIREEEKFPDLESLKKKMEMDKKTAMKILKDYDYTAKNF